MFSGDPETASSLKVGCFSMVLVYIVHTMDTSSSPCSDVVFVSVVKKVQGAYTESGKSLQFPDV